MTHEEAPPFSRGAVDRDAGTRLSEAALDAAWVHPDTRVMRLRGGVVALAARAEREAALDWMPVLGERGTGHVFLGRVHGAARFAQLGEEATVGPAAGGAETTPETESVPEPEPAAGWHHPFEFSADLDGTDRETLAVALALANWHQSAAFSPRDGGATTPVQGGWARLDAHGGEHFPRTDPAVIVLVEHEDRLLLGSNVLWETGRFSLLAGFVEAGESAEETVVREVAEEAGVRVTDVRYVASQPWPFPRSLMLGFRARLADGVRPTDIVPAADEISELHWFTRDELRNPAPGLLLPGSLSIARWLIDRWIAEGDQGTRGQSVPETGQGS